MQHILSGLLDVLIKHFSVLVEGQGVRSSVELFVRKRRGLAVVNLLDCLLEDLPPLDSLVLVESLVPGVVASVAEVVALAACASGAGR